jgi:hypothetical protein
MKVESSVTLLPHSGQITLATHRPPLSDFIMEYTKYADIFEAPPEAHEAVAMTSLAAAVNGNVSIDNGGQHLTLDFWTLLLSGSGVGRNTLVSLLWPILEHAKCPELVRNTTWGSKAGFYQDLAENPSGFFVWEELSTALKALSDSRLGEAKQWLTNLYDNERPPSDIVYRKSGGDRSTPPINFGKAPRTCILATSSLDWFIDSLSPEDSGGGFIPRWFIVKLPNIDRAIPIPKKPDTSFIPGLANQFHEARKLRGPIDLSAVNGLYCDWYCETAKRFKEQPNQGVSTAFWNRHRTQVLKLAALFGIAESGGTIVSPRAMERAFDFARRTEQTVFELVPTGMNREGAAVEKIEQRIRAAGICGLLKSELTRAFQDTKTYERDGRIRTLLDAGVVLKFNRPTNGRSADVLVHSAYAERHATDYPTDNQVG